MDRKWNVLAVAIGIAGWIAFGAGSAFADVQCVKGGNLICNSTCDGNFLTIQTAVSAASSGDTVCVAAGTYNEQVIIQPPHAPLMLQGATGMTSIIQPTSFTNTTTNLTNGKTIRYIVLADGTNADDVTVSDFTIDGIFASGCSAGLVGIYYRASSGAIENNDVAHIAQGCSNALGIFVQTDKVGKTKAIVAINKNTVEMYGKNGITANEAGTFVTVHENMVTGDSMFDTITGQCVPPEEDIVQNGVQIGFSARGIVTGNIISNHCFTPPTFVACGVLFFKAGGGPGRAQDNTFILNEGNVCNASGAIGSAHSPFNE